MANRTQLPMNPEIGSTRLRGDGGSIPQSGAFTPAAAHISLGAFNNYQNIGTGIQTKAAKIQNNNVLVQQAKKILSDEYNSLARTYASNSLISINAEQMAASENYLKSNPSGNGYAAFMSQSYQQSIEREVSNAPDSMTANLISAQANITMMNGIESAVKREKSIKTDYVISQTEQNREVLLQQAYNDPYNAKSLRLQYESALLAVREFIPDKFATYRKDAMEEFTNSMLLGLIDSNPMEALKRLKSEVIPDIQASTKQRLINYAEHRAKEFETKAEIQRRISNEAIKQNELLNYLNMKHIINSGTGSEALIDSVDVSNTQRSILRGDLVKFKETNKKRASEKDKYLEMVYSGSPILGRRNDVANEVFLDVINTISVQRVAEGLSPKISNVEKAKIVIGFNSDNTFKSLCEDMRISITRGTPSEAFDAATAIELINERNPNAIKDLSSRDFAYASFVLNNSILQGATPYRLDSLHEKALDMFYKSTTDEIIKQREHRYRAFTRDPNAIKNIADQVSDSDESWFKKTHDKYWDPINDAKLHIDAKKIAKEKFIAGMESETDVANSTISDLNRTWGFTAINGVKHFMKYPPEKMFPQLSASELRRQASEKIQYLARLHHETLGKNTQIRPGKPGTNIIRALVDDKWVEVPVLVDSVGEKTYSLYYLEDTDNLLTRRNLTDPSDCSIISFRFGPPRQKGGENADN